MLSAVVMVFTAVKKDPLVLVVDAWGGPPLSICWRNFHPRLVLLETCIVQTEVAVPLVKPAVQLFLVHTAVVRNLMQYAVAIGNTAVPKDTPVMFVMEPVVGVPPSLP